MGSTARQIERVRRSEIWTVMRLTGLAKFHVEPPRASADWDRTPMRPVAVLRQLERAIRYDARRQKLRKDWNRTAERRGLPTLGVAAFRAELRRRGGQAAMRDALKRMRRMR